MTRTDSKLLIAAVVLPLSLAAFPSVTLAGETVTIDGTVSHNVYGNGDLPDGALTANDPANLQPPADNTVIVNDGGRVNGRIFGAVAEILSGLIEVTGNSVTINGGEVSGEVDGGSADSASGPATATNNSVTIDGGLVNDWVRGGEAWSVTGSATATDNRVTIIGGVVSGQVNGGAADSDYSSAEASNNSVTIRDGSRIDLGVLGGDIDGDFDFATGTNNRVIISDSVVNDSVFGASAGSGIGATGTNNSVIISGSEIGGSVRGASARGGTGATGTNNSVIISGSEIGGNVYGASARSDTGSATATGNSVTLFSNGRVDQDVSGGYAESNTGSATAKDNTVSLIGGTVNGSVDGGNAWGDTATAENNSVVISDSRVGAAVTGGNAFGGSTTATGNTVTVSGNSITGYVIGGESEAPLGSATATANTVTVSDGVVNGDVLGANVSGDPASATDNRVTVSGGEVRGDVYGAFVWSNSGSAAATNNSVVISGGRIDGNIYGGYSGVGGSATGSATGNTVNLYGAPEFGSGSVLYGGFVDAPVPGGNAFTGNTLNLHSAGLTVKGLANFEYLNFYLPATLAAGDTVLTVTDTADITNGKVNVGIEGTSSLLQKGDSLTLIDAASLIGSVNGTATGQGMESLVLRYGFDVATSGNQLRATVTSVGVNPQTKALPEAFLGGVALVSQSVDVAAGKGMSAMLNSQNQGSFGLVGGGSSRYNTGSHVNVDSFTLVAGVSGELQTEPGKLTLGAFVSHGEGDYDTHNSFSNAASVKGKGDTEHTGLGLLARLDFNGTPNGYPYIEASLQGGRVKTDFRSGDLTNGRGQGTKYDSSSNYYGAHLGAGYVWNLNANTSLDLYGQYLYARRGGDKVHLENTVDTIRFSAVESHRARLGARVAWTLDRVKPYAGLAWEHEFDSEAKATAYGFRIDAPELKGDTGVVELGLVVTPSRTLPVTLDFGIQGYTGKREGASGGVRVGYKF